MIHKTDVTIVFFLFAVLCLPVLIDAQTAKPAGPSRQQAADAAARKQLASYMADFRDNPEDTELRDKIIDLAKTLKPAPVVPQAAKADFAKAIAQLKAASTAADYRAAAKAFEQVAAKVPWYADAYYNTASAYAKANDYDSANRNLTLYMDAARPGTDTTAAEDLRRDLERQQSAERFRQALSDFRSNPNDSTRGQLMKLAQTLKPAPEIPEAAHEHLVMAAAAVETATQDNNGYERAIEHYHAALQAAPWYANGYKRLAMVQKAAKQYDDAVSSLNVYLLSQPPDARDAQDEIYKLRVMKQAAAEDEANRARREQEERQRAYEASPEGRFQALLRKFDGKRYVGECSEGGVRDVRGRLIRTCAVVDIRGRVLILGGQDSIQGSNTDYHEGGRYELTGRETTSPVPPPNPILRLTVWAVETTIILSDSGTSITMRTRFSDRDVRDYVYRLQ
jgi:tetratricopeptide (TPR) repeat protein